MRCANALFSFSSFGIGFFRQQKHTAYKEDSDVLLVDLLVSCDRHTFFPDKTKKLCPGNFNKEAGTELVKKCFSAKLTAAAAGAAGAGTATSSPAYRIIGSDGKT